jgi:hypothetical protein
MNCIFAIERFEIDFEWLRIARIGLRLSSFRAIDTDQSGMKSNVRKFPSGARIDLITSGSPTIRGSKPRLFLWPFDIARCNPGITPHED